MLNLSDTYKEGITASVRTINARVELYNGSTLAATYTPKDILKSVAIYRLGEEGKFFGFGVCQKVNIHLIDPQEELEITTANSFKVYIGVGEEAVSFPEFQVTETHRDKTTGELSITAYDYIKKSDELTMNDIAVETPYTIRDIADSIAFAIGANGVVASAPEFSLDYEGGANFEGTEKLRDVLTAIAEATQTIFYIGNHKTLVFKRLDKDGEAVFSITPNDYIELEAKDNRRLATVFHATQLGDNISASTAETGSTQYIRDNPFWELREDITTLVDNALTNCGGMVIGQFSCTWRGDPALEIGDKIKLVPKKGKEVCSYVINDTIQYDGTLSQLTSWQWIDNDAETFSNPTSIGDAVKYTFAQVDKINHEISMVASEAANNTEAISNLLITTESISATVAQNQQATEGLLEGMNEDIAILTNKVEAQITAEDVTIAVQKAISDGVTEVTTETGFTFNADGLTVSKSGSEMETTITEDGMTVYKNGNEVLTANNEGVKAIDLHATTYLIIGKNSRLEDYGSRRTACFWIGG